VIMLKQYMHKTRKPRFSKSNLYLRDLYECGYCGNRFGKSELTTDHVTPISKGGGTSWTNCITACKPCNWAKSDKVGPEWRPRYKPYAPGYYELVRKRKSLPIQVRHPSWNQWLDLESFA
jgi:5-methylcytosine-specific restriction endonuclease McrA